MKKNYLFFLVISGITYGQHVINFDSFNNGNVVGQTPLISLWPGGTSALVTTAQAVSGTKSMVVRNNTTDDVLFDCGNKTSGTWSVRFKVYIPTGKDAFWNIQNTFSVATPIFNGQFFFGNATQNPNPGGVGFDQDDTAAVAYPSGQWFTVVKVVNLDTKFLTVNINGLPFLVNHAYAGNTATGTPVIANSLGAINFYSINADNEFYIDDFELIQGNALSSNAFDKDVVFSVYPNPTTDYVHVNMTNKTVQTSFELVDLTGRVILTTNNDTINMSDFNSGLYIINVLEKGQNIGSTKIMKK